LYSKIKIKCGFESNGCQTVCKIEDFKSHEKSCKLNPIVKGLCDKQCGALISGDQYSHHNCVQHLKTIIEAKDQELAKMKQLLNDMQNSGYSHFNQKRNSYSKNSGQSVINYRIINAFYYFLRK
jgi:hypothetical protein